MSSKYDLTTTARLFEPDVHLAYRHFMHDEAQVEQFKHQGLRLPPPLSCAPLKRQAEFLAGRWCARRALESMCRAVGTLDIGVDRAPVWPVGTVGAISHSVHFAIAAAAVTDDYRGIGLDAEVLVSDEKARKLAPYVLDCVESENLSKSVPCLSQRFTAVFSIKESLFKAAYPIVGRRFYFEHAKVTHLDLDGGRFCIVLSDSLDAQFPQGRMFCGRIVTVGDLLVTSLAIGH